MSPKSVLFDGECTLTWACVRHKTREEVQVEGAKSIWVETATTFLVSEESSECPNILARRVFCDRPWDLWTILCLALGSCWLDWHYQNKEWSVEECANIWGLSNSQWSLAHKRKEKQYNKYNFGLYYRKCFKLKLSMYGVKLSHDVEVHKQHKMSCQTKMRMWSIWWCCLLYVVHIFIFINVRQIWKEYLMM